jgi:hypothetical protein
MYSNKKDRTKINIMNKKVYCINCKYSYIPLKDCFRIVDEVIIDTPIKRKKKTIFGDIKTNENNDCAFYKRKWYKFWIK